MRHALGASLMLASLVAGHAYAQSPSSSTPPSGRTSALAEQLFNQARQLAKANQWAEACPKFEASLRYDPVLGTRLNLATCYERIGKLATAWGLYRESTELARKAGDHRRADYAQKQATALEVRLPRLAITAPASAPAGLIVKRDDTTIDASELGVALYVDPGMHKVTASAPGFEDVTVTITVGEGHTETLAIPHLVARPATAPVKPPVEQHVDATEPVAPASRTRSYVAIGVSAAGVAAVTFGLVFGAQANAIYGDAKTRCAPNLVCNSPADYDTAKALMRDARSKATTSTVLVVGGGAAIVAGAIVFLTAPRAKEPASTRVMPVTHDRGAGLAFIGEF